MSASEQRQLAIGARLGASPYFTPATGTAIAVYVARPRVKLTATMIQDGIDNALATLGAAVIVQMPTGSEGEKSSASVRLKETYVVRVIENPLINMGTSGTSKSAEDIRDAVMLNLHHFLFQQIGAILTISAHPFAPNLDKLFIAKKLVVYDVFFEMSVGLKPLAKTPDPLIGVEAGIATLTPTGGSAIYYTTDGTYPAPSTAAYPSTAQLYENPFAVTSGTQVLAVAYLPNLLASNEAFLRVP